MSTDKTSTSDKPSRKDLFVADPSTFTIVGIDTPDDPSHPLCDTVRNKLPLDKARLANIRAIGIMTPVLCRKVRVDGVERIEVIFGRQRIRHARAINAEGAGQEGFVAIKVPYMLRSGLDDATLRAMVIAENEVRQDDSIVGKAKKLAHYMALTHDSKAQAAVVFGQSVATIAKWLAILDLPAATIREIEAGTITPTMALKQSKVPDAERKAAPTTRAGRYRQTMEVNEAMRSRVAFVALRWQAPEHKAEVAAEVDAVLRFHAGLVTRDELLKLLKIDAKVAAKSAAPPCGIVEETDEDDEDREETDEEVEAALRKVGLDVSPRRRLAGN